VPNLALEGIRKTYDLKKRRGVNMKERRSIFGGGRKNQKRTRSSSQANSFGDITGFEDNYDELVCEKRRKKDQCTYGAQLI